MGLRFLSARGGDELLNPEVHWSVLNAEVFEKGRRGIVRDKSMANVLGCFIEAFYFVQKTSTILQLLY